MPFALVPNKVRYLVVHCSATKPSMDIGVKEIDSWHKAQGWYCCGYHKVIRRDGTVEDGRSLSIEGAHVLEFNACSVGICLVGGIDEGGKPENNFTPEQFEALKNLILELKPRFPEAIIFGHRDFPGVAKACPSFDCRAWWKEQSA
jgi:N-acetylmuramoyl-L-alanine amidase